MPNVQVKSEPSSVVKDREDLTFQTPTSSQSLSKRPMSLDLKNTSKKRLMSPSHLVIDSPDLQPSKPLTTPDLEKILHFLPTPQPGLLFQTKSSAVTSEQEAFGKGFEEALHSLHNNSNKSTKSNINEEMDSSPSDSANVVPSSSIASGMSGGSFTYTDLESFNSFPIKDEPQNRPVSPSVSPIDMETQEKIKLERKRQRNRVAASKCRKRKLERISKLEEKVKILKGENTDLGAIVKNLKEHVAQLKQQVIEHIESGCSIQTMCNGGVLLPCK